MIVHKSNSLNTYINRPTRPVTKPWIFQRLENWMQIVGFLSITYKMNSKFDFLIQLVSYFFLVTTGFTLLAINLSRNERTKAESFGQFIMWATCLSQIFVFFKTHRQNQKLWNSLVMSWVELKSKNTEMKNKIIKEIEHKIVIKSYVIQYLGILVFISYNFFPIFICSFYETNILNCNTSLNGWFPYDTNNIFLYTITYIFFMCITAFGIFTTVISVTFYTTMMDIIAGHLKLLNVSIFNCEADRKLKCRPNNVYLLERDLKMYIKEHQQILRWCATFEGMLNRLMLVMFIIQSLFIIFTTLGNIVVPLYKLSYAMAAVISPFYILLYFNSAHNIINEGLKLSDAVYFCGWEQVKHSKHLLCLTEVIILRSQRPIYFTIGKCNKLILHNFLKVNLKFLTSWIIFSISNHFDDK